jgi:biotin-dependent carboxylase-like uncharacterized protein
VIEILEPGALATIQDLGRDGHVALGVGESGAADRGSFRLANRLVGNAESAAAIELTYGGFRARFNQSVVIALTGASCAVTVGERMAAINGPIWVAAGQELVVGLPTEGLRTYVAVRGGIDVPMVLGSRCTDVLSGIGPQPLRAGSMLATGTQTVNFPNVDIAPRPALRSDVTLGVLPGPRDRWFTPAALTILCSTKYSVTSESNRVGARLAGAALDRAIHAELPSEGMVRGAVQVPPSGQPILFLADHPVTGGYPVIAVVCDEDLDRAGQLRPGDRVRFHIGRLNNSTIRHEKMRQ